MQSDYKTTLTYFIVVAAFIYSVATKSDALVSVIIVPMIIMWLILKTNSKDLAKTMIEALKSKWSNNV